MSDFRLPQRCKWDLRSSGVLRGEDLYLPTFGPRCCRKTSVSKHHSTLPDIQEKRSSQALRIVLGTPGSTLFILGLSNDVLNCQD
jgi:hypothetical protein